MSLGPDSNETVGFEDRVPAVGFQDVAGLDHVVEDLTDVVGYLADPAKYKTLQVDPPAGILLSGEPGCGKTLLARALAGEVGVPFYFVSATSFVERFVGLGASRIRELFSTAGRDAPCVVFVDELDAVGRRRTAVAGDREFDHTLNQLLVELDGFLGAPGVIVMAATNRPELLDPALVRPGRFDRHIVIQAPGLRGREAVLRLHAGHRPIASDVEWAKVAEVTHGCTPAELAALVNEAGLLAARHGHAVIDWGHISVSLTRLVEGGLRSADLSPHERERRAAHEAGHALAAWRLPSAPPRTRSSLLSCGTAGNNRPRWGQDGMFTAAELEAQLVVLMAGRAAEELLLGSPSTLCEDDLVAAHGVANRVVSARLHGAEDGIRVEDLVRRAHAEAARLIGAQQDAARSLAMALQERTALFADDIRAVLAGQDGGLGE